MEIKHSVRFGFSRHSKNLSLYIENILSWTYTRVPLVAQMVQKQLAMQKTQVRSLGWEDPQNGMLSLFSHITQNQKKRERLCVLIFTFKTV